MLKQILLLTFIVLHICSPVCKASDYFINGYIYNNDTAPSPNIDRKSVTPYNDTFDLFKDHANGYQILVPKKSIVDISMSTFKNTFTTNDMTIEIYYDDLSNKTASFTELINYSNNFLRRGGLHTVTAEYYETINGQAAYTAKWHRRKLARLENDQNYYTATSVQRTSQKIYTILIKAQTPSDSRVAAIIKSLGFIQQAGPVQNYKLFAPSKVQMNELTQNTFHQLFGENSGLTWGIFEYSAPQTFRKLDEIEEKLNHRFKVLLRYQTIDEPLPVAQLERAWENDRIVELTLATIHNTQANALWAGGATTNARVAYDILDGKYDEYFVNYAKSLKEFGKPILFRLNNEMNGDWCWYSAFYTARDPQIYIQLWHYLKAIFDSQGVDNLIWVWNPHDVSLPDFSWNHFMAYYPGDEYVDVIGLTGYNNGTYFSGEKWRTFNQIYQHLYSEYSVLFDKPFMLTEFSSSTYGGNKAAWIDDMFANLDNYLKIKVAVWWNGVDYDKNDYPGRIYLIDDSPEVVEAMKKGLANYPSKVKIIQKQKTQEDEPILRRVRKETLQP